MIIIKWGILTVGIYYNILKNLKDLVKIGFKNFKIFIRTFQVRAYININRSIRIEKPAMPLFAPLPTKYYPIFIRDFLQYFSNLISGNKQKSYYINLELL